MWADTDAFTVGGSAAAASVFASHLSEGDEVRITGASPATFRLTDRNVAGTARDVAVDAVAGVARFAIGGLGDDPLAADDELFAAVGFRAADQRYIVDGDVVAFDAFAAALSDGDGAAYRRSGGLETFDIENAAPPATSGTATETSDPDGDPAAPESSDGGSLLVLVAPGPGQGSRLATLAYGAGATFTLNGTLATEAEWEARLTAGDLVSVQPGDPGTGTAEAASLEDRDLAGRVADVSTAAKTYDVVSDDGIVYDDLAYTAGAFGGVDTYVVNEQSVGLAQFEAELTAVAAGERPDASVVVRAVDGGTEHRLSSG